MSRTIEEQLLEAAELFHYSYTFRNAHFVLTLEDDVSIEELTADLKVLQSSHISMTIVCRDNKQRNTFFETYSKRGIRFSSSKASQEAPKEGEIGIQTLPAELTNVQLLEYSITFAEKIGAAKVFYLSQHEGILIEGRLSSHLSHEDLKSIIQQNVPCNLDRELLTLLGEHPGGNIEIVLLRGIKGNLFQEIFTHRGKGTLITEVYPNVLRSGTLADVSGIAQLLRPYIEDGSIRATSEDQIADDIEDYSIYTVNGALVAAAKIVSFGDSAELAKFCTLPRYQGKGRAKELAEHLIEKAKEKKFERVFALSVSEKMWIFFTELGFTEVARDELPAQWKKSYDFSRDSKAFQLSLT